MEIALIVGLVIVGLWIAYAALDSITAFVIWLLRGAIAGFFAVLTRIARASRRAGR